MTDDRMALIEKGADGDLVRDMLAFAAERIMEIEVEAGTGAGHGSRSPDRTNHRNGYRERPWETRAGRVDLAAKGRGGLMGHRVPEACASGPGWSRSRGRLDIRFAQ